MTIEGSWLAKFKLGRRHATPGAIEAATAAGDDLLTYLARHAAGDWGTVAERERRALREGTRLLSAYLLKIGMKICRLHFVAVAAVFGNLIDEAE